MVISVNNNKFNCKVVSNSKDIAEGMMGKTFDNTFEGLLFLMGGSKQCFWMKNCITNLDIIIIKNNH